MGPFKCPRARWVGACVMAMLAVAPAAGAETFVAFDIPGWSTGTWISPQRINGDGVIAGYFIGGDNIARAFVRDIAGNVTTFSAPGATADTHCPQCYSVGTWAFGLNSAGAIVGYFVDDALAVHGFLRSPSGTFTQIDVPDAVQTQPISINDTGTVAGYFVGTSGLGSFVRSPDGIITTFAFPGAADYSGATAVNASGTIVGYYSPGNGRECCRAQIYLRSPDGQMRTLPALGYQTTPAGINDSGTVVGVAYTQQSSHAFVRPENGAPVTFDVPGAAFGTSPLDINAAGAVTGVAVSDVGGAAMWHSFIRFVDGSISQFDPPGMISSGASGINSAYVVAGVCWDGNWGMHAYVRLP